MVESTRPPWHPEEPFGGMFEPLRGLSPRVTGFFAPLADASASGKEYLIHIELPGVKAEDIDVSIHDNMIMVRGEKRSDHDQQGRSYFFSERMYGNFYRSFRFPPDIRGEEIRADLEDGILIVRVEKSAAPNKSARKIPVRKA